MASLVQCHIGGERVERAADHAGGSVWVATRTATVDESEHPPYLAEQIVTDSTVGELVEQVGQPRQTVEARTALPGALLSEVGGDVGDAGQTALVVAATSNARTRDEPDYDCSG